MGQIDLFKNYSDLIGVCAKKNSSETATVNLNVQWI